MAMGFIAQVRQAIQQLSPNEVREQADRPIHVGLIASRSEVYAAMEDFFAPPSVSRTKRLEVMQSLHRADDPGSPASVDLQIVEAGLRGRPEAFVFSPEDPARMIPKVLAAKPELALPLSRAFLPFRTLVADKIVFDVSKENAMFSVMTALPDLAPGWAIPWAIPEAVSDTAVLTANQVRMAFLLASASDRETGYSEQKTEIASIIAGAFGWRALARQLVGKLPLGGGIIPKAAVAFAATYVEGVSIERLYRAGYGLSKQERKDVYGDAFRRGKEIASTIFDNLRRDRGGEMYKRAASAKGDEPAPKT